MPPLVAPRPFTITGASSGSADIVYAKWSGRTTVTPTKPGHHDFIDSYDVTIHLRTPIAVGRTVKLLALSLEAYHTPAYPPPYPPHYDIYDPQIEGKIIRIRSIERGTIEFALENKIRGVAVTMVYIAVQYVPNVTVKLDMVDKAYMWLTRDHPNTRFIPLERAIIVDTIVTHTYTTNRAMEGPVALGRAQTPEPSVCGEANAAEEGVTDDDTEIAGEGPGDACGPPPRYTGICKV